MHGVSTQLKNSTTSNNRYAQKNTNTLGLEQGLMVGASSKLSARFNTFPTRLFNSKVICRHPSSPRLGRSSSSSAWLDSYPYGLNPTARLAVFNCHSSSCLLAQQHGVIGATIWHALLPSSCFRGTGTVTNLTSSSTGIANRLYRRFPLTTPFIDGSWNVAGDARPARWLHDSAWLLFGFCSCFPAAAASAGGLTVPCCEASSVPLSSSETEAQVDAAQVDVGASPGSHGKTVYKEFSVIGIPGDGRCLFRAVAHGVCTREGKPAGNEDIQRDLADELRGKVVDELIKRRSESEWFIEGDFDQYTQKMREPHVWGGEPELLMLSHVLKLPITVYMSDRSSNGLIAIAEYGQEYGKNNPIKVLYHGFGHYDALQIPAEAAQSKL